MTKISNYFYIFSKLTTSLLLLFLVSVMGYMLFLAYQDTDDAALNKDAKEQNLSVSLSENNQQLLLLNDELIQIKKEIDERIINIEKNNELLISEYKSESKKIIESIDALNLKLVLYEKKFQKKDSLKVTDFNKVDTLVTLILRKYLTNENIDNEIILLQKITPQSKNEIFEKLSIIRLNKFYGISRLKREFDLSTKEYVKNIFNKEKQSNIISFLFQFVNIQPRNLSEFENNNLNILSDAKKLMINEKFEDSLSLIKILDKDNLYFLTWYNQVSIYLEFKKTITKVL